MMDRIRRIAGVLCLTLGSCFLLGAGLDSITLPEFSWPWSNTAPFAADTLTVVVKVDTSKPEPKAVSAFTEGAESREYLKAQGAVFRRLDFEADVSLEPPDVQAAWKSIADEQPPAIAVSNGRSGFAGPLPIDEGAALELVKKYGDK